MLHAATKHKESIPYRLDYINEDTPHRVICIFVASHGIKNFPSRTANHDMLGITRTPISDMFEDELNPQPHELEYFELIYGHQVTETLRLFLQTTREWIIK